MLNCEQSLPRIKGCPKFMKYKAIDSAGCLVLAMPSYVVLPSCQEQPSSKEHHQRTSKNKGHPKNNLLGKYTSMHFQLQIWSTNLETPRKLCSAKEYLELPSSRDEGGEPGRRKVLNTKKWDYSIPQYLRASNGSIIMCSFWADRHAFCNCTLETGVLSTSLYTMPCATCSLKRLRAIYIF